MIIRWTVGARNDLQSIRRYIGKGDPDATQRVVLAIVACGETLTEMSLRGREGRVAGTHELVLAKLPYTIAYRITDKHIDVLRIIHQARLWPDML
jgi:plasmid stabilization system protein ParE